MPAPDPAPPDVTQLLRDASKGDHAAFAQLVTALYGELNALARRRLRNEQPGHTLSTTGLVHEAYLRLVDQSRMEWRNREQFFAIASEVMRRVLVDHARARNRDKRGGRHEHIPIDESLDIGQPGWLADDQLDSLLSLDDALTRLAEFNPEGARIVQLRFFGGLSNAEVADVTDASERTVRRIWSVAKAWLRRELGAQRIDLDTPSPSNGE